MFISMVWISFLGVQRGGFIRGQRQDPWAERAAVWCKYFHHSQLQANKVMPLNLELAKPHTVAPHYIVFPLFSYNGNT